MKIPLNYFLGYNTSEFDKVFNLWDQHAKKLSLEHGILIDVRLEAKGILVGLFSHVDVCEVTRIFFKIEDLEFDSLNDLKKALKNKAFL